SLAPGVLVDVQVLWNRVSDPFRKNWEPEERKATVAGLTRELLPEWGDAWLSYERERWDQLRIHALERIASELLGQGDHFGALETALEAVALEPIRETAHRIVVEVHLAEGNKAS